jgi:hypothetical protein
MSPDTLSHPVSTRPSLHQSPPARILVPSAETMGVSPGQWPPGIVLVGDGASPVGKTVKSQRCHKDEGHPQLILKVRGIHAHIGLKG